jgi:hypothetical protein
MKMSLTIREGRVRCPARGSTSVAVCRSCPDYRRADDSGVVCEMGLGLLAGGRWSRLVGEALKTPTRP